MVTSSAARLDGRGPSGGDDVLLRVDGVTTRFATARGPLLAVDDVSLELRAGETLGIVGESGSGKSVLVRSIMGILPPTASVEGRVLFEGRDVRTLDKEARKHFWGPKIAMIFQDPMTSLNPVRTIGRQITDPLRYHLGLSMRAANSWALELLDQVGIPEPRRRIEQFPHELSGGMRQRVGIAIALSCQPSLLIADEPTTALDVTVQKQILDLLARLQRELHMAMVLITHDLGVVAGRCQRVSVMYAGRMVESADAVSLFRATRHPYTAALLSSIPRVEQPSHTPLEAIAGRPPDMVAPPAGCRFAPRCRHAQSACVDEPPPSVLGPGRDHRFECRFPVGTPEGDAAREANARAGRTAAGLDLAAAVYVLGGGPPPSRSRATFRASAAAPARPSSRRLRAAPCRPAAPLGRFGQAGGDMGGGPRGRPGCGAWSAPTPGGRCVAVPPVPGGGSPPSVDAPGGRGTLRDARSAAHGAQQKRSHYALVDGRCVVRYALVNPLLRQFGPCWRGPGYGCGGRSGGPVSGGGDRSESRRRRCSWSATIRSSRQPRPSWPRRSPAARVTSGWPTWPPASA